MQAIYIHFDFTALLPWGMSRKLVQNVHQEDYVRLSRYENLSIRDHRSIDNEQQLLHNQLANTCKHKNNVCPWHKRTQHDT